MMVLGSRHVWASLRLVFLLCCFLCLRCSPVCGRGDRPSAIRSVGATCVVVEASSVFAREPRTVLASGEGKTQENAASEEGEIVHGVDSGHSVASGEGEIVLQVGACFAEDSFSGYLTNFHGSPFFRSSSSSSSFHKGGLVSSSSSFHKRHNGQRLRHRIHCHIP